MRKDKPSRTALKVAFNIVTLGSKPGMEAILPSGIVEPWTWSIGPEELGLFLAETGWSNVPKLVGTTEKHGVAYYVVATKSA